MLRDNMLEQDIIKPSCSPWASPIVRKKMAHRFCRFSKGDTKKDAHPLPYILDTYGTGSLRYTVVSLPSLCR